jgi:hypothetical protein
MRMREFVSRLKKQRKEWAALEDRLKNETFAAKLRDEDKATTIKLHEKTKALLDTKKGYKGESYESVILRLALA